MDANNQSTASSFCIYCGNQLKSTSKFCGACGNPVQGESPAVPDVPAVPSIPTVTLAENPVVPPEPDAPIPTPKPDVLSSTSEPNIPIPTAEPSPAPAVVDLEEKPQVPQNDAISYFADSNHSNQLHQTPAPTPTPDTTYRREEPEPPKKESKLERVSDGITTGLCMVFGIIYAIGGIVVAVTTGNWAGLLVTLYGVYLLIPGNSKLLIY